MKKHFFSRIFILTTLILSFATFPVSAAEISKQYEADSYLNEQFLAAKAVVTPRAAINKWFEMPDLVNGYRRVDYIPSQRWFQVTEGDYTYVGWLTLTSHKQVYFPAYNEVLYCGIYSGYLTTSGL